MEVWKPQNSKQQQVSHLSQRVQVKESEPTSKTASQQVKHTTSDSIRAIANVLNQHHKSKLLQQQTNNNNYNKKAAFEETAARKGNNNKLDQLVAAGQDGNKCPVAPSTQKGVHNKASPLTHDTCDTTVSATVTPANAVHPHRRQSPSNQVDQSNSYLYAYNDFVTLHGHTCGQRPEPQLDKDSSSLADTEEKQHEEQSVFCLHQQLPANHAHHHHHLHHFHQPQQQKQQHHLYHHNHHLEESLIDSEEDDALSYILHQHKLNQHRRDTYPTQEFNCQANQSSTSSLIVADFEAHHIDHQLSCARKSHPRHICGIASGSPASEKPVNAGRLTERGQANRKLFGNQPQARTAGSLALFESHKFTQDLTVLHNQLVSHQRALQPHLPHSQKHNPNQAPDTVSGSDRQHRLEPSSSSSIKESGQEEELQQALAHQLLGAHESSGSCESGARLTQEQAPLAANEAHQIHHHQHQKASYLNWFLCRFTNFLPEPSASAGASSHPPAKQLRLAHELSGEPGYDYTRDLQQEQQIVTTATRQVNLSDQLASAGRMYSSASLQAANQGPVPTGYYAGQPADLSCPNYTRHHHHHYPISSESSLNSSGPFASSASRINALFRGLCSKKCVFVSCLALILLIFIAVISLSAYLNFLINLNRTSLMPLSGRLKVDTRGDAFTEQLNNRSSPEYLDKQQQYETILRGAFDRTEWALKSYPNHLVKCEVYSFRPGSLWVYFRLFINKRTLLLDQQLMRRRAYDEQLDQQFLPLLTQQTLHSGLRQLMETAPTGNSAAATTTTAASSSSKLERRSRASSTSQRSDSKETRLPEARNSLSKRASGEPPKSFDDQINRLMPIITAIDLLTIEVSSDYDILRTKASSANLALRAPAGPLAEPTTSSPFTTPFSSSSPPVSPQSQPDSAGSSSITDYDFGLPSLTTNISLALAKAAAKQQAAAASNGVARVFTLFHGYKENITRPTTSARPTTTSTSSAPSSTTVADKVSTTDTWPQTSSTESSVVRLESGQPVLSQNWRATGAPTVARNITLFGPFLKFDQSLIEAANTSNGNRTGDTETQIVANVTGASSQQHQQQMVAPYQQNNFFQLPPLVSPKPSPASNQAPASTGPSLVASESQTSSPHDMSIQELWNNTIANKRNLTRLAGQQLLDQQQQQQQQQQSSAAKRLITITAVDAKNLHDTMTASNVDNKNKAPIPYEVSSSLTSTTFSTPFVVSEGPPVHPHRVSPHLKQGGSIISLPGQRLPQLQLPLETGFPSSAVLLSKELPFQPLTSQGESPQLVGAASSNSSQQVAKPQPISGHGAALASTLDKARRKPSNGSAIGVQAKPISLLTQANSASANLNSRQFLPMKEAGKIKKIAEQILSASGTGTASNQQTKSNATDTAGSLIKSKGIRIVDNYLASMAAANRTTGAINGQPALDLAEASLPSGIELTRSVTGVRGVVENHSNRVVIGTGGSSESPATQPLDYTTTSPTTLVHHKSSTSQPATISITTDNLVRLTANSFSLSSPNSAPTSGFSNQWKPMAGTSAALLDELLAAKNRTSIGNRKPPVSSLIVGNEKLVQTINVPSTNQGSQSPFAMPAAGLLDTQPASRPTAASPNRLWTVTSEQLASRGRSPLPHKITTSTYRAPVMHVTPPNEFESHRVSRMRHQQHQGHLFTSSEAVLQPASGKPVELQLDTGNATSQLPSVLVAGVQQVNLLTPAKAMAADSFPVLRKTRGPFAFESLKSMEVQVSDKPSDMSRVFPGRSLLRKELTLDTGNSNYDFETDADAINSSSTIDPIVAIDDSDLVLTRTNLYNDTPTNNKTIPSETGNGTQTTHKEQDFVSHRLRSKKIKRLTRRQQKVNNQGSLSSNSSDSFRCQYYGCRAKKAEKFICLNYTQICDDFIDCQDESDELDCVSLMKHDSQTNRLSFSNGAGIIYLNRRGSLAPLCIDYYHQGSAEAATTGDLVSAPLDSAANTFESLQWNSPKRQQELIRQINAIGQYACRLQSFSRLVSVKINHNSLVDGLDLIKKSKLYHRLSIVEVPEGGREEPISSTFQSSLGNVKHGVEVSTSSNCPSQRTAFVKCGSFECGQDSFSVMDKAGSLNPRDGLIINDFPWLVKLYWQGSLSCHGYLIDDLWVISSNQCLGNKSRGIHNVHEWTAEISQEHYGLHDYQSIESNRRNIKIILPPPSQDNAAPSFVLAKLENPVRFSPLNRPICLPMGTATTNKTTTEFAAHYKECVTVTLPGRESQLKQDLVLKKAKVLNPRDCYKSDTRFSLRMDSLTCVSETGNALASDKLLPAPVDSARVLICSQTQQATRNRSRWTLVGVQTNLKTKDSTKLLFSTVSNQMDWIVDTMNPKSHLNSPHTLDIRDSKPSPLVGDSFIAQQSPNNSTQQVCNNFKCSTGECLSWSRICDGLYDCSSHEDEKDCHK